MAKKEKLFGEDVAVEKKATKTAKASKEEKAAKRKYTKKAGPKKVGPRKGYVTIEVPAHLAFEIGLLIGQSAE